ncbi:hypothetical protein PTSG_00742 [Salpingoeca rosetta]|uniref:Cilia- and flagella-associated protein 69 ARM repeats domain-containing protein n=1 Tax=Salpingoeca rosetta (strain ATCC 50818 / BSB-021) TaxID=946362 RepID=F2TXC4_SALR5|nr:uncharacterized protein PTSG_00742 [Salpingoeca rosetta]EGD76033.1 hypothetical protein PTSG_00742 [Salpingoeca rosetta]|eukprot:XP_004998208.1 hypothetical protein PTSG_00742 [Salpingoeca rosetta]
MSPSHEHQPVYSILAVPSVCSFASRPLETLKIVNDFREHSAIAAKHLNNSNNSSAALLVACPNISPLSLSLAVSRQSTGVHLFEQQPIMDAAPPMTRSQSESLASSMKKQMPQFPHPNTVIRDAGAQSTSATTATAGTTAASLGASTRKMPVPPPIPLSSSTSSRTSTLKRRVFAVSTDSSQQQDTKQQTPPPPAVTQDQQTGATNDVAKLYKLLTGKHSQALEERHDHALRKVLKRRPDGYIVEDLQPLPLVLEDLAARAQANPTSSYAQHLVHMLELLVKPIDFADLADQRDLNEAEKHLAAVVSAVTALLNSATSTVLATAIFVLDHLVAAQISAKRNRVSAGGVARAWQDVEIRVVEQSRIAASLRRPLEMMLAGTDDNTGRRGSRSRTDTTANKGRHQQQQQQQHNDADTATASHRRSHPHVQGSSRSPRACELDNETQGRLLSVAWGCSTLPPQQHQMVKEGLPRTLCLILGSPHCDVNSQEGLLIIEMLWNCMEGPDKADVVALLDSSKCTQALTDGLRAAFQRGDSKAMKQARNDLIALIALFTRQPSLRDNLVTGHTFEFMLRFACCGDVPTRHPDCRSLRLNNSDEDFEALKLLLTSIVPLLRDPNAREVIQASNIVPLCLKYMQYDQDADLSLAAQHRPSPMKRKTEGAAPTTAAPRPRNWTASQYEELQLLVLSILPSLLPAILPDFSMEDGAATLVRMLNWALNTGIDASRHHRTKKIQGAANSFLATQDFSVHRHEQDPTDASVNNGKRVHTLHIMKAIEVLFADSGVSGVGGAHSRGGSQSTSTNDSIDGGLARSESTEVKHSNGGGGGGDHEHDDDDDDDERLKQELQQQLLDEGLLSLLLTYLSVFSPTMDDMVLILKTHAWRLCSLLCTDRQQAQDQFHPAGGVETVLSYLKLDLASVCADEENHNLMLATLDACWSCVVPCEAARALFLKSEGVYVLLDILEGSPDSLLNIVLGILTDLAEHPHVTKHMTHWSGRQHASVVALLVALWEKECTRLGCPTRFSAVSDTQPFPLQAHDHPGSAVANVYANLLGKIYSLLSFIGFDLAYDIARPAEKATLVVIEQYLNLKSGEVWHEIAEELKHEGIQPVEHDEECLRLANLSNLETIQGIAERQEEALHEEAQQTRHEEQKAFATLRQSVRLADALAQEEQAFVQSTSGYA